MFVKAAMPDSANTSSNPSNYLDSTKRFNASLQWVICASKEACQALRRCGLLPRRSLPARDLGSRQGLRRAYSILNQTSRPDSCRCTFRLFLGLDTCQETCRNFSIASSLR